MKNFIRFLLVFLVFSCKIQSQDKPVNPIALDLFIQGKTLELQDNYLAAIEKYNQALMIEKAPGIHYTLSKLYYNLSQYQKSLDNALIALKLSPDNLEFIENAADVYIMLNDYRKALELFKEVIQKRPDDINVLYNIGRIYEAEKQPSEAIKYYEKITEEYTYDETVLRRMISIYENYKDYANEASALEKLLSLDPTNYELKKLTIQTYLNVPDYDNALRLLENILSSNPKNQEVLSEMIKIYFRQNRTDLAFEKFGQLINKDSVDFSTKMGIALAYFQTAQEDSTALYVAKSIFETIQLSYSNEWMPEFYLALIDIREKNEALAEQKFQKILVLADTSVEAHVQIGFVFFEQNKFNEANNIFIKGLKSFPEDFRLNYFTGLTYYRLGNNKQSYPYLEKALSISPTDINVLSTLGLVYDNLFMDEDCERIYMQAFKYYPDNILLLNNYAYHLSERGKKLLEALEMSKKTIEREPENPSYLDTYGWIYFKLKDYKNALKYIEKAVKLGSNPVLLEHLGDVYE
ncbi:MAG: tetratricopeptide repeat protein, partial [Ignavibacteria bacterium]